MADIDALPFHLTGAFAPVPEVRTDLDLEVIGEIPADLRGTYVRNGPRSVSIAGVVRREALHGVRLERGRATYPEPLDHTARTRMSATRGGSSRWSRRSARSR